MKKRVKVKIFFIGILAILLDGLESLLRFTNSFTKFNEAGLMTIQQTFWYTVVAGLIPAVLIFCMARLTKGFYQ